MCISDWSSDVCSSDLSPSAPRNDEGLFRRRLVVLFPRACPRIEELAPIGLGHILGDAVMFGPAVLRQVEGAEDLVEEGEVDREIDVESLAFEPVVPVVEAWGREPVAEPVETAPDIGVEQRRPDIDEADIRSEEHQSELQSLM